MVFWLRSNAERLYKSLSIWLQLLLFFFLAWHFITTSIIVEYVSGIQPVLHYHRNTTNMLTEFSFRFCFSQSTFYNRGSFSKIINSFSLFFWDSGCMTKHVANQKVYTTSTTSVSSSNTSGCRHHELHHDKLLQGQKLVSTNEAPRQHEIPRDPIPTAPSNPFEFPALYFEACSSQSSILPLA